VAIIPTYNEERFIGSVVLAVREHVDEVIVVDDGSRDRTAQIASKAGATVIRHGDNWGKAASVNTGFAHARQLNPQAVVLLDGDGQHRADDIPIVLRPVVENVADVVIGSRFLETKSEIPIYRQVGLHGLNVVTNIASGLSVSDTQSGFRAFSPRALVLLSFGQEGFALESEIQFQAREHNLRMAEVPIKVTYDERAKRNPIKHGIQVIDGVIHLVGQKRPLLYFGGSGLVMFLSGATIGLYLMDFFVRTQRLAIEYGLLAVLLCVTGMVLVFAGVILHAMRSMLVDLQNCMMRRLIGETLLEHRAMRQNEAVLDSHEVHQQIIRPARCSIAN
jgi:glycosyltransferase involved in cell wall biosynthesis